MTTTVSKGTADRCLSDQVRHHAAAWARSQCQLVIVADVETCTTREWLRIGRCLRVLPATADAFATRELSYSKVRSLTRIATPTNEHQLLEIARSTPANRLPGPWQHG